MLIVVLVIVRIESDFDKAEMLKPLYNFVNVTYPHHSIVLYFYQGAVRTFLLSFEAQIAVFSKCKQIF